MFVFGMLQLSGKPLRAGTGVLSTNVARNASHEEIRVYWPSNLLSDTNITIIRANHSYLYILYIHSVTYITYTIANVKYNTNE
jgi:hypothetical protein